MVALNNQVAKIYRTKPPAEITIRMPILVNRVIIKPLINRLAVNQIIPTNHHPENQAHPVLIIHHINRRAVNQLIHINRVTRVQINRVVRNLLINQLTQAIPTNPVSQQKNQLKKVVLLRKVQNQ